MTRTKTAAVAATAIAMFVWANPAQAASTGTGQSTRTVSATGGSSAITPLSADETVSRTTVDAGGAKTTTKEHNRFYRDSQGRTRHETGSIVTISDPAAQATVRLDTKNGTYVRTAAPAGPSADRTVAGGQITSQQQSLGTAQIGGVTAQGRTYTVSLPATGQLPARSKTVTVWLAEALRLTIETSVSDPSGESYVQSYSNISTGKEPSADLFTIPAGYLPAGGQATTGAGINAPCPVTNGPDPLILNSYGPSFGSGYINASTDITLGCFFYGSAWYFEFPLQGWATVPLGLPFDQWFVRDNGCYWCLPYLPWVAIGDVVFSATNTTDVTTKDSFIILTVWCC